MLAAAGGVEPFRLAPNTFIAHTQPGLEPVAWSEIAERIEGAERIATRSVPGRNGLVIFTAPDAAKLSVLRCAEDLFAIVGYRAALRAEHAGLQQAQVAARSAPYVEQALQARVRVTPGSKAGRRLKFRVITRTVGRQEFRRLDLQRALERGLGERGDHRWRLAGDDTEVEVWGTLCGHELLIAIRLSDERMRHRDYKVSHLPGSLRPAMAAAMAWLSEPRDDDIVLDPMCGAGTILIERASLARYRMLLGGDSDVHALAAARENVGPRFKPIDLKRWDAQALPLEDLSVSKLVTNLPWGRKVARSEDLGRLYPRFIREFLRVVRPGGIIVLMSAATQLMRSLMVQHKLKPRRIFKVTVLGAPAEIYVCPR